MPIPPPHDPAQEYTVEELLGLFQHFDSRVGAQEALYVPLSFGGLGVVVLAENSGIWLSCLVGLASISLYFYHLVMIRKYAVIQNNIFQMLEVRRSPGIRKIIGSTGRPGGRYIGLQFLRFFVFVVLNLIWITIIIYKAAQGYWRTEFWCLLGLAILLLTAASLYARPTNLLPNPGLPGYDKSRDP